MSSVFAILMLNSNSGVTTGGLHSNLTGSCQINANHADIPG
jgi:hypothetical protein